MLFVQYPKCTTCQKAKKWLEENNITFEDRDIKLNNPTAQEIAKWHEQSNLPIKKFFNTSGLVYKDLKLKDKLPTMSLEEQIELLASNGMLVKRPVLISEKAVLLGFKQADWEKALL